MWKKNQMSLQRNAYQHKLSSCRTRRKETISVLNLFLVVSRRRELNGHIEVEEVDGNKLVAGVPMCDEFISNARSFFVCPMFRCLLQYNIWITIGNSGIVPVWVHWIGNMELSDRVHVFCIGKIVSLTRKMCNCCNCWYVPCRYLCRCRIYYHNL